MTRALDPDTTVIALVDDDVAPHDRWLRDLVVPLADDRAGVGATFGIPCCAPPRGRLGSLVRAQWWTVAGIAMALRGWPWGGSTAMTVSALRASGLEERWAGSLSSDTPAARALASIKARAVWVPLCVVLDSEEWPLRAFVPQLVRYLLVRRLYLPSWHHHRLAGLGLVVALVGNLVVIIGAVLTGSMPHLVLGVSALVGHIAVNAAILTAADRRARSIVKRNGIDVPVAGPGYRLKWLMVLPLFVPLIFAGGLIAQSARTVTWRGVRYEVGESPHTLGMRE